LKRVLVWLGSDERARSETRALAEVLSRLDGIEVLSASDREHALAAMREVDGFVTSTVFWDADFARSLRRADRLRWIQVLNVGFDNMERLGVPGRVVVSTLADVGSGVVAEHAVGLLLALLRGLPAAAEAQRTREWNAGPVVRTARTLDGLDAAIVGFGHIGRKVAAIVRVFGARAVAFARSPRTDSGGIEVRALPELRPSLPAFDAVLICAPLNAATRGLLDAGAFAAMRRGSYLVNVSRGGIVDTAALVEALRSGTLAGAALDVVDPEPLPPSHSLWSLPNVLLTPHTAWAGGGAAQARQVEAVIMENVGRFARGEALRNVAAMRHSD
jgi:phosphoglycerate dehydrogenase-like enzyme